MQFREEQIDEIKIVESFGREGLEEQLTNIAKEYILVDVQYSTRWSNHFSTLVLLRRKNESY